MSLPKIIQQLNGQISSSIVLKNDPINNMDAATKQYADSHGGVTSVNGEVGDVTLQMGDSETVTLLASNWNLDGDRYSQTISTAKVTASMPIVLVDVNLTGVDLNADATVLEAWQSISANNVVQGNGLLTFYSYDIININIPVNVGVC